MSSSPRYSSAPVAGGNDDGSSRRHRDSASNAGPLSSSRRAASLGSRCRAGVGVGSGTRPARAAGSPTSSVPLRPTHTTAPPLMPSWAGDFFTATPQSLGARPLPSGPARPRPHSNVYSLRAAACVVPRGRPAFSRIAGTCSSMASCRGTYTTRLLTWRARSGAVAGPPMTYTVRSSVRSFLTYSVAFSNTPDADRGASASTVATPHFVASAVAVLWKRRPTSDRTCSAAATLGTQPSARLLSVAHSTLIFSDGSHSSPMSCSVNFFAGAAAFFVPAFFAAFLVGEEGGDAAFFPAFFVGDFFGDALGDFGEEEAERFPPGFFGGIAASSVEGKAL
eukprot:Rhum_TRINITY_DN14852_c5_g1::Rhum_TRINITY_DN14852_c5_g1_i1::g.123386::m.123386